MLVQCFADNGDLLGMVNQNKAHCLVRKHLAVIAEVDNVLCNCVVAIKLDKAVPVQELFKKNWR